MNKLIISDADSFVFDYAVKRFNEDGEEMHLYTQTIYLGKRDSADNYIEVERFKTYFAKDGYIYEDTLEGFITIDLLNDSILNHKEIIKEAQENVSN